MHRSNKTWIRSIKYISRKLQSKGILLLSMSIVPIPTDWATFFMLEVQISVYIRSLQIYSIFAILYKNFFFFFFKNA